MSYQALNLKELERIVSGFKTTRKELKQKLGEYIDTSIQEQRLFVKQQKPVVDKINELTLAVKQQNPQQKKQLTLENGPVVSSSSLPSMSSSSPVISPVISPSLDTLFPNVGITNTKGVIYKKNGELRLGKSKVLSKLDKNPPLIVLQKSANKKGKGQIIQQDFQINDEIIKLLMVKNDDFNIEDFSDKNLARFDIMFSFAPGGSTIGPKMKKIQDYLSANAVPFHTGTGKKRGRGRPKGSLNKKKNIPDITKHMSINELVPQLNNLLASFHAGNHSHELKNEVSDILNALLRYKLITKKIHKSLLQIIM